jgi:hypothetical protein
MKKVTVAMSHYNTPELIQLSVALWSNQTIPCDIWIIDTGSDKKIDEWASKNVRIINIPKKVPTKHISEVIAVACQYAQDNCETEYLMQTHIDVFPKSKYLLEYWMSLMGKSPVVGYGMSDRSFVDDSILRKLWESIVGHSLTMVDVSVMRGEKIEWYMQKSLDKYHINIKDPASWDTEVTFGLDLMAAEITPYMAGRDKNFRLLSDAWHSHCRSYTTGKLCEKNYSNILEKFDLSLSVLQKEFTQEFIKLKHMLADSWKVDINEYNPRRKS